MDIFNGFSQSSFSPIKCIDMHTTGEPTRIIIAGYPDLPGDTLLEKRQQAKDHYDHLRLRLMLEPRGHWDMYGALLIQETEFVKSGEADIGVLFMHNDGYSTMCGHATIALGRFLVDTHDRGVFPRRNHLHFDPDKDITIVRLHAPCGVVQIAVPTMQDGKSADYQRRVSFISTPAFASAVQVPVEIPPEKRWPELNGRTSIILDVSCGGTFYAIVSARELGFPSGLRKVDMDAMGRCVKLLKSHLVASPEFANYIKHPTTPDLSFLYSVMVVDDDLGVVPEGSGGAETGLCYFADHQIDRSPTGSCVVARMALAHRKGLRRVGQRWTYHSLVSNAYGGNGGFTASIVEEVEIEGNGKGVLVEVEGKACYTGSMTLIAEDCDPIAKSGFSMKSVSL
ncbi:proline racemase [Paecilomyces variotii No. 5]|uniref:trans-L-3-hydroxyproline dehydratase n=1 Tax=Byssochlamys spectabilis (strain No. 5 / NBRC 109023) TaxID=1356009 RepID=V5FSZ9_BYSSN|nr:proline racemase [Paecilomyces variotii No. 5]